MQALPVLPDYWSLINVAPGDLVQDVIAAGLLQPPPLEDASSNATAEDTLLVAPALPGAGARTGVLCITPAGELHVGASRQVYQVRAKGDVMAL